jgi:hypothetical protein
MEGEKMYFGPGPLFPNFDRSEQRQQVGLGFEPRTHGDAEGTGKGGEGQRSV